MANSGLARLRVMDSKTAPLTCSLLVFFAQSTLLTFSTKLLTCWGSLAAVLLCLHPGECAKRQSRIIKHSAQLIRYTENCTLEITCRQLSQLLAESSSPICHTCLQLRLEPAGGILMITAWIYLGPLTQMAVTCPVSRPVPRLTQHLYGVATCVIDMCAGIRLCANHPAMLLCPCMYILHLGPLTSLGAFCKFLFTVCSHKTPRTA